MARVGETMARRIFMSAKIFSSQEAVQMGILAQVCSQEELNQAVEEEISHYLKVAPGAAAKAKNLTRKMGAPINKEIIHYTAEQLTATGGNPIFKRYHNLRRVDSFLFADYYSFARPDTLTALKDMHKGFQNATLRSLQQVELENISVKLNNPDG